MNTSQFQTIQLRFNRIKHTYIGGFKAYQYVITGDHPIHFKSGFYFLTLLEQEINVAMLPATIHGGRIILA